MTAPTPLALVVLFACSMSAMLLGFLFVAFAYDEGEHRALLPGGCFCLLALCGVGALIHVDGELRKAEQASQVRDFQPEARGELH